MTKPIQRVAGGHSAGFRGVADHGETLQYRDPDAGKTPFGADPAAQPAVQPAIPTPHGLPEPVAIGPLLMKPAGAGGESVDGRRGGPQFSAQTDVIPEKIEPSAGFSDKPKSGSWTESRAVTCGR